VRFVIHEVAVEEGFLRVSLVFPFSAIAPYSSIIALTRRYIATSLVSVSGSSLLNQHLVNCGVKKFRLSITLKEL
jgi:hypothetical protein